MTDTLNFRIHFEHQDGTEDSFDVAGGTVADIREKADTELAKPDGTNPWSEEL